MKKLLIILFLIVNTEANAQISFKTLDNYLTEQGGVELVLQDVNSLNYVLSRCAGFFLFYSGAVKNLDEGKLTALYAEKASNLMFLYINMYAATQKDKGLDIDTMNNFAVSQIMDIKNLYRSDMDQNYIETGENIVGSYLEDELALCDAFNQIMELLQSSNNS